MDRIYSASTSTCLELFVKTVINDLYMLNIVEYKYFIYVGQMIYYCVPEVCQQCDTLLLELVKGMFKELQIC